MPLVLYTDPIDGDQVTATLDPSGWWVLETARGVFITADLLAALQCAFTEHDPTAQAARAIADAFPPEA
jgi:hypothetical protein